MPVQSVDAVAVVVVVVAAAVVVGKRNTRLEKES